MDVMRLYGDGSDRLLKLPTLRLILTRLKVSMKQSENKEKGIVGSTG